MKFLEAVEFTRKTRSLNEYYHSVVYAKDDTLEIFVIEFDDEICRWYGFYCMDFCDRPLCFRAVTDVKQADAIFDALCNFNFYKTF